MKRLLKWVAILLSFVVSAGVGAYIAAHAQWDQGAVDVGSVSNTTAPSASPRGPARWHLRIDAASEHQLFVGGSCKTRWAGSTTLVVQHSGRFQGAGSVSLRGGLACDFAVPAKSQVKTIDLKAVGTLGGSGVEIRFTQTGSTPAIANDLGGFQQTLLSGGVRSALNLKLSGTSPGPLRATAKLHRDDGDRGEYLSTDRFVLTCATNC